MCELGVFLLPVCIRLLVRARMLTFYPSYFLIQAGVLTLEAKSGQLRQEMTQPLLSELTDEQQAELMEANVKVNLP